MSDPNFTDFNDAGEQRSSTSSRRARSAPFSSLSAPAAPATMAGCGVRRTAPPKPSTASSPSSMASMPRESSGSSTPCAGRRRACRGERNLAQGPCAPCWSAPRGIRPDDKSEAAQKARQVNGWGDFDGCASSSASACALPEGAYRGEEHHPRGDHARAAIWRKVEQLPPDPASPAAPRAVTSASRQLRHRRRPLRRKALCTRPQWAR